MVILTESSPPFFFQKYDLPSDPILLILVPSDHNTPSNPPIYSFHGICKKLRCSSLWLFWEDFCQDYHPYKIMKVVCLSAFMTVACLLVNFVRVVWWASGETMQASLIEELPVLLCFAQRCLNLACQHSICVICFWLVQLYCDFGLWCSSSP